MDDSSSQFRQRPDLIKEAQEAIGEGARPYVKRGLFIIWDEIPGHAQSAAGIIMPPQATENLDHRQATVLAVAPDVSTLKVGDRVIINKFIGTDIPYQYGNICKLKIVSEDQIDALLVDEKFPEPPSRIIMGK